jgi:hypothetical protein
MRSNSRVHLVRSTMPTLRPRVVRADRPHDGRIPVAATSQDSLLSAIIKWIPIEVVGAYEFIGGLIPSDQFVWIIGMAVLCLILSPIWIFLSTSETDRSPAWRQIVISPFAFLIWIVAIDPHVTELLSGWKPWMGSTVLAIGTLLLPIIDSALKHLGLGQN